MASLSYLTTHIMSQDLDMAYVFVLTALQAWNKIQLKNNWSPNCIQMASASLACWQSP